MSERLTTCILRGDLGEQAKEGADEYIKRNGALRVEEVKSPEIADFGARVFQYADVSNAWLVISHRDTLTMLCCLGDGGPHEFLAADLDRDGQSELLYIWSHTAVRTHRLGVFSNKNLRIDAGSITQHYFGQLGLMRDGPRVLLIGSPYTKLANVKAFRRELEIQDNVLKLRP